MKYKNNLKRFGYHMYGGAMVYISDVNIYHTFSEEVLDYLKTRREKCVIIMAINGYRQKEWFVRIFKGTVELDFIDFYFSCNCDRDENICEDIGAKYITVSTNCFVDEKIFSINDAKKDIDVIMVAQMHSSKNMEYAKDIDDLFVVTYGGPSYARFPDGTHDLFSYCPELKNNKCNFNEKYIGSSKVSELINRSKVGIILSKKEGACRAAVEYMLCGIPVVSTVSIGGRDKFASNGSYFLCELDSNDIRDICYKIINGEINANSRYNIREKVLKIMNLYRKELLMFLRDKGVDIKSWDRLCNVVSYFSLEEIKGG